MEGIISATYLSWKFSGKFNEDGRASEDSVREKVLEVLEFYKSEKSTTLAIEVKKKKKKIFFFAQ